MIGLFTAGRRLRASELNLIVDQVNALTSPACSYTTNGTMATSTNASGGAETAMTAWTGGVNTSFVFKNLYTFEVKITGGVFNTDAAGTTATSAIRVRKGVNTTSGQQLLYTKRISRGGSDVETFVNFGYVKNASGADITTALGVTIQRISGAANNSLYGDANIPLIVTVTRLGLTADLTGLPGVAVSIV